MRVRARSLLAQYVLFGLALAGSYVVLAIGGLIVLGTVASGAFAGGEFNPEIFMQNLQGSFTVLVAIIFGYLLLLAAFSLMAELFLGLGFWKLVAQGASITGLDSLHDVRARGEDTRLGGEGLRPEVGGVATVGEVSVANQTAYRVDLGSYATPTKARAAVQPLAARGFPLLIVPR